MSQKVATLQNAVTSQFYVFYIEFCPEGCNITKGGNVTRGSNSTKGGNIAKAVRPR